MHLKHLIFLLPFILFAQKKNIAVLQFDAENVTTSEAKILTNRLNDELFNFGKFTVIERAQIEPVLKEQEFQQSGCVSSECAVEAGKLLGVDQIVTGSIGKIGSYYTVSARMIDVQTGEVLKSSTRDVSGSIDLVLLKTMGEIAYQLSNGYEKIPEITPKTTNRITTLKEYYDDGQLKKVWSLQDDNPYGAWGCHAIVDHGHSNLLYPDETRLHRDSSRIAQHHPMPPLPEDYTSSNLVAQAKNCVNNIVFFAIHKSRRHRQKPRASYLAVLRLVLGQPKRTNLLWR